MSSRNGSDSTGTGSGASVDVSRRTLGRTGVEISTLGIGTAPLSGVPGPGGSAMTRAVLAAALRHGVSYVDTAPLYGAGVAESRVGAALAELGRDRFAISTKAGRFVPDGAGGSSPYGFSREAILRSIEASMARLRTDRIDIVLIHDPDDFEELALDQAYPTLHELRDQGVVGAIGLGMVQSAVPARFVSQTDIDAVLLAGPYTLLDQSAEDDLLPACLSRGCSVIIGSVFQAGILASLDDGDADRAAGRHTFAEVAPDVAGRIVLVRELCARHGVSVKAVAIQFPSLHPAVAAVLVGVQSVAELEDCLAMTQLAIPEQLWAELHDAGVLRSPVG